jgi:hypothetical protein
MLLDFGKYRGMEIQDVPVAYMIFLAGYKMQGTRRMKSSLQGCNWVQRNKKEHHEFAKEHLKARCWHCGGKLSPMGSSRANGAAHDDWDDRYLHKKCWCELKAEEESDSF